MNKLFLLILAAFFFFNGLAEAQSIVGISPANVEFKDILRGGYSSRTLTISLSSDEPIQVSVEAFGQIAPWISFPQKVFNVSSTSPAKITVVLQPPIDLPNGNYSGFIRVSSAELSDSPDEGHATGRVLAVLDVATSVEITDVEKVGCQALSFETHSVEQGDDIVFSSTILNTGNVRLKPHFVITIWDQEQITILKEFDELGEEILPTQSKEIIFRVPSDNFDYDQYWADVKAVDCFSSQTLTFDVLEEGTLKAEGILVDVSGEAFAIVGDTIPFFAIFRNTGEKEVSAQFKGRISKGDKIVQLIESEQTFVPLDETTNFTFYFTAEESGDYLVSGRVFYDKKRTYEESFPFSVYSAQPWIKQVLIFLAYVLIIAFLVYLAYKIHRERTKIAHGR